MVTHRVTLDAWLWEEPPEQVVYDTLLEMHIEEPLSTGWYPEEIAKRAGISVALAVRILEKLRGEGKVGRRAVGKGRRKRIYFIRRHLLWENPEYRKAYKTRIKEGLAILRVYMGLEAEEASEDEELLEIIEYSGGLRK